MPLKIAKQPKKKKIRGNADENSAAQPESSADEDDWHFYFPVPPPTPLQPQGN